MPKAICDTHRMMSPEDMKFYVYKFTDDFFLTENEKHIILSDDTNIHLLTITKKKDKFKILLKTGFSQTFQRRIDFKIYFKKSVDLDELHMGEHVISTGKRNLMQIYSETFDSGIFYNFPSVTLHLMLKKRNYPIDLFTVCPHITDEICQPFQ
jgi:hypothetical protein